jgi:hypothetical protein
MQEAIANLLALNPNGSRSPDRPIRELVMIVEAIDATLRRWRALRAIELTFGISGDPDFDYDESS